MEFTPQELWAHTGTPVRLVILVMLVMAVWCLWVTIDRLLFLGKGRKQSRLLAEAVGAPLGQGDAAAALAIAQREEFKASYLGHLLAAGLREFEARPDRLGIDSAQRAIERASISEGADLRRGLNILATTGATAPFVGLVGTIFGIINAFSGMAEAGGGGLGAVSAGIAEALVTTAIGITVAIMGVWMFNYFTARIDAITNDMTGSMQEFLDWCEKRVAPAFGGDSKDDPATA
jgi:biopolymer transport protein ExbB/TolQ